MDQRQMEIFIGVVEAGSFSKYAENSFITRTNVKRQFDALEEEVGVALIRRSVKGIILTEAGEYFYKNIKKVFAELERIVQKTREQEKIVLRLACNSMFRNKDLDSLTDRLLQKFPNYTLILTPMTSEEFLDAVKSEKVDASLGIYNQHEASLLFHPIQKTRLVCILQKDHPLSDRTELSLEDLKPYPISINEKFYGDLVEKLRLLHMNYRDIQADGDGYFKSMSLLKKNGCYITVDTVFESIGSDKIGIKLNDPAALMLTGIYTRSEPSCALLNLIKVYRELCNAQ